MKRRLGILTMSLALLGAWGCGGGRTAPDISASDTPTPIENKAPVPPPTSLDCPKGTNLSYENFGESVMLNYCTSCHSAHVEGTSRHGAPSGANFDLATDVSLWRMNILDRVNGKGAQMPPATALSAALRKDLAEWLNCGAPSAADVSRLP